MKESGDQKDMHPVVHERLAYINFCHELSIAQEPILEIVDAKRCL